MIPRNEYIFKCQNKNEDFSHLIKSFILSQFLNIIISLLKRLKINHVIYALQEFVENEPIP